MKIPSIKFLSPLDRAKNLLSVMEQAEKQKKLPDYDRKVKLLGREYTVREVRSMYKFCRQAMDGVQDSFEKGVNK